MKRSILDWDSILIKKYKQYLLPSIMTSLALALNEFADYMIISNLMGEEAFAAANLAAPMVLGIAACYMLLGSGGSGCYAVFLGRWEKQRAGSVFSLSVYLAWVFGIVYAIVGFLFRDALTNVLCPDRALLTYFSEYYETVLLTAPFIVAMLTTIWFLPPSGAPVIATIVNIVSNIVNIIMDFVYMKGLDLGIRGSVLATFTGYVVGMLVMIVMMKKHNIRIANAPVGTEGARLFTMIVRLGASVSLLQVCFAVRYSIGNQMATQYAGQDGVVSFSLCLQTFSIASIFILGTADAAQPILAMLNGQMDYQGEAQVLKRSLFFQVVFGLGLVGILELFPGVLVSLYRITGPDTIAMAIKGVRIFALTYLTRGICIQFMRFFLVVRKTRYALLISLFDGLGVIPAGLVLCGFFGIDGLFMSYPVSTTLLFISIIVLIRLIIQRSPEKYMGGLPIRRDTESYAILKRTITEKATEISKMSMEMTEFCKENGIGSKQALFLGLACEEMAVYTGKHRRERDAIDILLRITEKDLILNFRSVGQPFDPMQTTDEDIPENILMLHKIASKISYDYIMGMNNTRIILPAE